MRMKSLRQVAVATGVLMILPGCAGNGLGVLGDILGGVLDPTGAPGAQQGQVVVEIQGVNTRQQSIQVRTERGETGTVMYDQNTVVVYRQQQYPVTALERGDIAAMQIQQIDRDRLYTSRIDVQQSVQERTGQTGTGQLQQVTGRVGQIDHQRGFFDLQTQQGTFTVILPNDAGPATRDYFHRLRTGETVVVEGRISGTARIDLHRFV
jgi:hypothetical protein